MRKRILALILFIVTVPVLAKVGENPDFWIMSQKEYDYRVSSGKDVILRRYIVVPHTDKSYKSILELDSDNDILYKFSYMLQKNKKRKISDYILNYDRNKEINFLIVGLYLFSQKQYSEAIKSFEQFNNPEYKFLKYLLIADCKYESLSIKSDYKTVLEHYQIALDIAQSDREKKLIKNRVKFIKYR